MPNWVVVFGLASVKPAGGRGSKVREIYRFWQLAADGAVSERSDASGRRLQIGFSAKAMSSAEIPVWLT